MMNVSKKELRGLVMGDPNGSKSMAQISEIRFQEMLGL